LSLTNRMPDMVPVHRTGRYAVSADRLATRRSARSNDGRDLWNALHANELHGAHRPPT